MLISLKAASPYAEEFNWCVKTSLKKKKPLWKRQEYSPALSNFVSYLLPQKQELPLESLPSELTLSAGATEERTLPTDWSSFLLTSQWHFVIYCFKMEVIFSSP